MASDRAALLYEANRRGLLTGRRKAEYDEAFRRGLLNVPGAPQYAGPVSAERMQAFAEGAPPTMAPPPPKPKAPDRRGLGAVKGRTGAALRGAVESAAPTGGALAAGATLGGLGAAAGLATGPFAPVVSPVLGVSGAISGALGGGKLTSDIQQWLLDEHPELAATLGQTAEQRAEDEAQYPLTRFAGQIAPSLATGKPSKAMLNLARGKLGPELAGDVGAAAIGGGLEALSEGAYQGGVDWDKVGLAALASTAGARPNRVGRALSGKPPPALDTVLMESRQRAGRGVPSSLGRAPVLESVGIKPSAVDILPDAALEEVVKAAQSNEALRAASAKYAKSAALETPRAGKRAASLAVPEAPNETPTSRRQAVAETVRKAEETAAETVQKAEDAALAARPVVPDVEPASGGRAISERLNREYNEAYERRGAAYKEAEAAGPAYFEDLTPGVEKPRGEMSHWVPAERDGQKGYVLPTGEFKPESAVGPMGPGAVAEAVRTRLNEGSHLAQTAPEYKAIQTVVDKIGSAKTANDLYALRRQFSDIAVEAERAGNVSISAAARTAKNALDDQMDQLASAGRFTDEFGYPEGAAVEKWTNAIAEGRDFARQFRGNDPIEEITRREYSGGEQGPRLNPDAVTQRLLGKGPGVVLRQEGSRELAALRRRLGADSPEWQALRQEATARILRAPDPAKALAQFESKNPKAVVDMLITPDERAAISKGPVAAKAAEETKVKAAEATAGVKAQAETVEKALETGSTFLTTPPIDFRRSVKDMDPTARRDARVALRTEVKSALSTPRASAQYLGDLVVNDDARANLVTLLGNEGRQMLKQADALAERYGRAQMVSPPRVARGDDGKLEATLGTAADVASHAATGGHTLAMAHTGARSVFNRLKGLGLSKAEAAELADQVFDPAKVGDAAERIRQLYGESAALSVLRRVRARTAKNAPLLRQITQVAIPGISRASAEEREALNAPAEEEEPEAAVTEGDADTEDLAPDIVIQAIGGHEGTGKNPASSAVGPYQFIDSTFARYAAEVAPDLVGDADPTTAEGVKAINKLRGQMVDGVPIEELMMRRMTEDNAEGLKNAGLPATPATQYLAHFSGLQGALKALQADPNASISDVLDAAAIRANSNIEFNGKRFAEFTAQDLIDWARDRMNRQLGRLRASED